MWNTDIASPSPLPSPDSDRFQDMQNNQPNRYSAYRIIFDAEQNAFEREAEQEIMCARVVGHLLLEFHSSRGAFGDAACSSIGKSVVWSLRTELGVLDRKQVVYHLGKEYRDKFIRSFRTSKIRYPPPSSHPSRPSFDTLEDMVKDTMECTGTDYRTSRKKALTRDGFRCMITGMFDKNSAKLCRDLQTEAVRQVITKVTVETAHILSESTMQGIDPTGTSEDTKVVNKTHYAAGAMAILESFGFERLTDAFKRSGGVHQVWNLLSLEHNLHSYFDELALWFESTEQHCYKVCVFDSTIEGFIRRNYAGTRTRNPMLVDFTPGFTDPPPPPDPTLLALHAICARVAHMSGAAEFFDQIDRDTDDMDVLTFDGSSAELLSSLISPFATMETVASYVDCAG